MTFNTKQVKKDLKILLGSKDISVRKGTGTLGGYLMIYSEDTNLWHRANEIQTYFPTYSRISKCQGMIDTL